MFRVLQWICPIRILNGGETTNLPFGWILGFAIDRFVGSIDVYVRNARFIVV